MNFIWNFLLKDLQNSMKPTKKSVQQSKNSYKCKQFFQQSNHIIKGTSISLPKIQCQEKPKKEKGKKKLKRKIIGSEISTRKNWKPFGLVFVFDEKFIIFQKRKLFFFYYFHFFCDKIFCILTFFWYKEDLFAHMYL